MRNAYRVDENLVVADRLAEADLAPVMGEVAAMAKALVRGVRAHKPSGVDAFLHAYDLEVNQYKDSQTHTDDA